jgi:hypothetical protein
MSQLSEKIEEKIRKNLPSYRYIPEYYVIYQNRKLFFDFFIPDLNVVVEVQGQQHFKFSKFFHGDIFGFRSAKFRDVLKGEWCEINEVSLVCFNYDEIDSLSDEEFTNRIVGV